MDDDGLPNLKRYFSWKAFRHLAGKRRTILIIIILVLAASLFFSVFFEKIAHTKDKNIFSATDICEVDPMYKIKKSNDLAGKIWQEYCEKRKTKEMNPVIVKTRTGEEEKEEYSRLMSGYPIEEMVPFISQKERKVAAFLIGIAKKESDWGKHSPQKNGRTCYNYWGYKGGYNQTDSGYSCFDSPEQAVLEVGGRIEKLLGQKIDTPERMVVWKCGSSCAAHDPAGVNKWISDVRIYYNKFVS